MNGDSLAARLFHLFLGEMEEQSRDLDSRLLRLESDPANAEELRGVFRVMHTLKGAAHAAGVPLVEHVCHLLESRLSDAREGGAPLEPPDFAVLFEATDALNDARQRLERGESLAGSPLEGFAQRRLGAAPAPNPDVPGDSPARAEASSPTSVPPPRSHTVPPEPPEPEAEPAERSAPGTERVRIDAIQLNALFASAAQVTIQSRRVAERPAEAEELQDLARRSSESWNRIAQQLRRERHRRILPESVNASADRVTLLLDQLHDAANRLAHAVRKDGRAIGAASSELDARIHLLRLRPFGDACTSLPRLARDLAARTGKEVKLQLDDTELQLDRELVPLLSDLLMHLVRNAIDHGIEPSATRQKRGKPPSGTIAVAASRKGDRLSVEVSDDGAGLDLDAIQAVLARAHRPVPTSEQDLAEVIFEPGFSTRTDPSTLSGRGVGLDAVRDMAERMGGVVRVESEPGQGTRFHLECPATLTTARVLLVVAGKQILAIPVAFVQRLLRAGSDELGRADGRQVLMTAGGVLPIVSLSRVLGPPLQESPLPEPLTAMLLEVGGRRLAVAIDDLLGEDEIVVRRIGRDRNELRHLNGAALLASGKVALVVNVPPLVEDGLAIRGLSLREGSEEEGSSRRPRILVADDSITTRTLEQSILEAAGYEVVTAVDGLQAWHRIQEAGCDLLLSDVEMPHMDGFALCEAVRSSERFATLPVVLVTALERPEHRMRGMEAGADAYLPKSSFDQEDLLHTIRQLLGEA